MLLKNVRTGFMNVWAPRSVNGGKPTYGVMGLIDPGSENDFALLEAMSNVAAQKWGAKGEKILDTLVKTNSVSYHTHAPARSDGEEYDFGHGMRYFQASNKNQPMIIGRYREALTERDGRPYPGCICNVDVDVWAQDKDGKKRINVALMSIQFWGDGDAITQSRKPDAEAFPMAEDAPDV